MKGNSKFLIAIATLVFLLVSKADAQVQCVRDPSTGKWINPSPGTSDKCVIPSRSPSVPNSPTPTRDVMVLESSGEITIVPAGGLLPKERTTAHPPRPIPGALNAGSPVELNSVIRTGATGRIKVALAKDHTVEAGANTDFLIEQRVYGRGPRTDTFEAQFRIKLYKGLIKLKLLRLEKHKTCVLGSCRLEVVTPCCLGGVRGTEAEFFFGANMAGYIKLYSGSVIIAPFDSDKEIILKPGEMLTVQENGSISGPLRIPPEQ